MSHLVERLTELRRHLEHLREIRPRVTGAEILRRDLSLHNDVLFSLQVICQLVIDISGELSSRNNQRFGDYTESVRNLAARPEFSATLVNTLSRLPGFRNVLIHEYVTLDFQQVVAALDRLEPVEEFAEIVRRLELEA
ncbi:MAG TPA: hypothetical protein DD490_27270 [Acidobacteria bacterium]|nr:hypothetical protein [Acidobacteriota bacterium]